MDVDVVCETCQKTFKRRKAEYNRSKRLGRGSFCSRSCAAKAVNASKRNQQIVKQCPVCLESFSTYTGKHEATFCSRSCASRGSVTEYRRNKAKETNRLHNSSKNLIVEKALKAREAWRYKELEEKLKGFELEYEFEKRVGSYIYDLALIESKTIIEFDEPYHRAACQRHIDLQKEKCAKTLGWKVVRVDVKSATIIPFSSIESYIMQLEQAQLPKTTSSALSALR